MYIKQKKLSMINEKKIKIKKINSSCEAKAERKWIVLLVRLQNSSRIYCSHFLVWNSSVNQKKSRSIQKAEKEGLVYVISFIKWCFIQLANEKKRILHTRTHTHRHIHVIAMPISSIRNNLKKFSHQQS